MNIDNFKSWGWNTGLPALASLRLATMHPAAFCIGWIAACTPAQSKIKEAIDWTKKQLSQTTPTQRKRGLVALSIAYVGGRKDASAIASLIMGVWQGVHAIEAAKQTAPDPGANNNHELKLLRNVCLIALTINELRSRSLLTCVGLVLTGSSIAPHVRWTITKIEQGGEWVIKDSKRIAAVALAAILLLPYAAMGLFLYTGAKTGCIALDHLRRLENNRAGTPWYGHGIDVTIVQPLGPYLQGLNLSNDSLKALLATWV